MRCALVTGGTRGIGRAVCDMLADCGFCIAFAYNRSEAAAREMIANYQSRGINCIAVKADLSDGNGADRLLKSLEGFPSPDTLVNNAGIAHISPLSDTTDADVERIMNVNFYSPLKLIRALSEKMVSRGFGRIVNISSMWAKVGSSCESVYSASKAAIEGLSKSLAKELGQSGITVNCVAPGLIDTDMNATADSAALDAIVASTPLARIGKASDVAQAVKMLVSKDSFVTGAVIPVNGGLC